MSRLLIKIIWFILGVAALFYGIKGIYFCFTGGTVETLDSVDFLGCCGAFIILELDCLY